MNNLENNWKLQFLAFGDDMKDALEQHHYAAQFIAMVGRHLIPQQPDDSNTNMEFIPEENLLLGNVMPNNIRIALNLSDMKIIILDITDGIKKKNFKIIENRERAIKEAIDISVKGDILLIAGKGHESYQILGTEKIHFDDREMVEKYSHEI